jgi:hypothetical protein
MNIGLHSRNIYAGPAHGCGWCIFCKWNLPSPFDICPHHSEMEMKRYNNYNLIFEPCKILYKIYKPQKLNMLI